jgi:hypothetical protein
MNEYISDRMAREHTDRLLAEAATVRRNRLVRRSRRRTAGAPASIATTHGRRTTRPAHAGTAVAHFAASPFVAFQSWLAAGQL